MSMRVVVVAFATAAATFAFAEGEERVYRIPRVVAPVAGGDKDEGYGVRDFYGSRVRTCVNRNPAEQGIFEKRICSAFVVGSDSVVSFKARNSSRYFSIYDLGNGAWRPNSFANPEGDWDACGGNEVVISANSGPYPHADHGPVTTQMWSGCKENLFRCEDSGLPSSKPCVTGQGVVASPAEADLQGKVMHNLGCFLDGDSLRCVGGLISNKVGHSARGPRVLATNARASPLKVEGAAFDNTIRGCIDLRRSHTRRSSTRRHCLFDGRFSLTRGRGGEALIFARANTNPAGGGRWVTVAKAPGPLVGANAWGAMEPIRFLTIEDRIYPFPLNSGGFWNEFDRSFHTALSDVAVASRRANIDFAAVNPNPYDGGATLVGLFPTAVEVPADAETGARAQEVGATLMSVSVDGVHWAPPVAIVESFAVNGETNDHPVDGLVVRDGNVFVYVHAGVPGTLRALCEPRWPFPAGPPPSAIHRLKLSPRWMKAYTADAVDRLAAAPPDADLTYNMSGVFSRPPPAT